jgi:beta-lactamase class A
LALPILIGGCSQGDGSGKPDSQPTVGTAGDAAGKTATGREANAKAEQASPEPPAVPSPRAPEIEAGKQLDETIRQLGDGFAGHLGIAVRDLASGWTAHFGGDDFFPQQSVSKLWVAVTVLDQVDNGWLDLSEEVTLERDDLTVFYQPVRTLVLRNDGYTTTLGDLLERAIVRSDNTANDFLLRRAGGPDAVRRTLAQKDLGGIRFGPGERELQSEIAGLEWKPEYSIGPAFINARAEVPLEERRAAFKDYLDEPMDGAKPIGIVHALARLEKGQLLSPSTTRRLLELMARSATGERRLGGGVPASWSIAHKTGTGQILEGTQTGYNDVGLISAPDGQTYAVAVLIGRTSRPRAERRRLMQAAVEAAVAYHRATDQ